MKFTFLGTGAGEGYPGLWCKCPHCDYARKHGGKNVRTNSCAVIDDTLMLDCGPACMDNAARFGVDITDATTLLVTQPHEDHLYLQNIYWRTTDEKAIPLTYAEKLHIGGPRFTSIPTLNIFGGEYTAKMIAEKAEYMETTRCTFTEIGQGSVFTTSGYTVTSVLGNHGQKGFAYSYIIEKDGKCVLYALDSGSFCKESAEILKKHKYDLIVMEGTTGLNEQFGGHMCLTNNSIWRKFFIENGCAKEGCRFILTHMSPHWCPPHDWYQSIAGAEGWELAYDGLTIEI